MHDDGVGFAIIDNDARELYVVVEVPRAARAHRRSTSRRSTRDLGPDGPIARGMARYEDRASQRDYGARRSRELYNDGGIGLLEAGTGVGKSFGYLVPALRWAAAQRRAHGRLDQHDQPAGAARRQGPAVSRRARSTTSRCGSRCSRGGATTSACSGSSRRASVGGTLFDDGSATSSQAIAQWAEQTSDGSLSDLPSAPRA